MRVFLIALFLCLSSGVFSEEAGGPCGAAIDQYQQDNQAFQSLTEDCRKGQVGYQPYASIDDCPSVDRDLFHSLVSKMEENRYLVCGSCQGAWPKRALGPGFCPSE